MKAIKLFTLYFLVSFSLLVVACGGGGEAEAPVTQAR